MLLRLLVALLLLAPAAASGQSRSVMLTSCVPNGFSEVQAWRKAARQLNRQRLAALRQEEAGRMAGRDDVWRDHDQLYLALDDDKVAVLTDCPYPDDGMHLHSWLGFDETGRFHITLADSGDDQTYLLVSRREGMPMEALSLPLWAPDKKKFAVGGCNLRAGRTLLVIASPSGGALSPEGTIELPCTSAPNCRIRLGGRQISFGRLRQSGTGHHPPAGNTGRQGLDCRAGSLKLQRMAIVQVSWETSKLNSGGWVFTGGSLACL